MANEEVLASVTLEGTHVRLEPLGARHLDDLRVAGAFPGIWDWLPKRCDDPASMGDFVDAAVAARARGTALPFATIDRASGRAVGSTRYHLIDVANKRIEIGWTWLTPAAWRTAINTESKYLLLRHAFETLRFRRVEFKADANNARSRAAILRLGATEDGVFRKHMLYPDGRNRDSVFFSILDDQWPEVERRLRDRARL